MNTDSQEKMQKTLEYFSEMNIELPTDVKNAIDDVFNENDNISSVEVYHKEDIQVLQQDLKLYNDISMTLKGSHHGRVNNIWTYYGGVTFSFSEKISLYKEDGNIEEAISDIDNENNSIVDNPTEYSVILHEIVDWDDSGEIVRTLKLYIYCPESGNYDE